MTKVVISIRELGGGSNNESKNWIVIDIGSLRM